MTLTIYEYPCNERIRCFLRLESLLKRLQHFSEQHGETPDLVFLTTLFDLLDVCDRGDVKGAVLQQLDAQRSALEQYKSMPRVDLQAVLHLQNTLDNCALALHRDGRPGKVVADNPWLQKLRNRNIYSGGDPAVEFPQLKAWLVSDASGRKQKLKSWLNAFAPLQSALEEMLNLIRLSGEPVYRCTDEQGVYSQRLDQASYQMIRIWLPQDQRVYPDISANRHIAHVRFYKLHPSFDAIPINHVLSFRLAFCKF